MILEVYFVRVTIQKQIDSTILQFVYGIDQSFFTRINRLK